MDLFDPQDYWEKRFGSNLGLHNVGYAGMGKGHNAWLYKVRRKVFLRIIPSLGVDLMKTDLLDIGSGTGFYIELWKELGVRTVGADFTKASIELALS